jgi:hypothetical protein
MAQPRHLSVVHGFDLAVSFLTYLGAIEDGLIPLKRIFVGCVH